MAVKTMRNFSKTSRMEDGDRHLDVQYDTSSVLSGNDIKRDMDDPSYLENDIIIIIVKDEFMLASSSSDNDSLEERVVSKLESLFSKNGKPNEKQIKYKQIRDLTERPGINYNKYGNKNDKFLCHICGELITSLNTVSFPNHLKRHEAMEANLRSHKCSLCGNAFNLDSSLRIHMMKVHDKEKCESLGYICSMCGKRSLSKEHILTCEAIHSDIDPLRQFECHCGEAFITKHKLVVHKNNKHNNKKKKVLIGVNRCKPSSQDLVSASELKKHNQAVHEKKINCPVCARELASIITLALHLKNRHGITNQSKEKTIKCRACGKSFVMFASFVKHTRDRHGREVGAEEILEINKRIQVVYGGVAVEKKKMPSREKVKMICPFCHRELANPASLNNHIETIHNIRSLSRTKSFFCGVCGKRFVMLSSYIYHKAKAHKEEVTAEELDAMASLLATESPGAHPASLKATCAQCGKVFKGAPCLRSHEYRVHRTKKIKCVSCKETFDSRQVYFEHKYEAHTPVEEKICLLCNKEFRSYSAHWGHKSYVHSTPSHGCDHCTSIFKRKGDLARHLRDKHGIRPEPAAGPDAPKPTYADVEYDVNGLAFEIFESHSLE